MRKSAALKMPPATVTSIDEYDSLGDSLPKSIPTIIERRKKALTAADLAELLPIKRKTFLQWAKDNRMPSMRLNGRTTFDPKTTAAWLRQRMTK